MSDDKLRGDLNALTKKLEVLDKTLGAVRTANTNLTKKVEALEKRVKSLEAPKKQEAKPKPKKVNTPVTIDGTKYKLLYPIWNDKGTKIVAADIIKDEKALAEQLEKYPGVFAEV